MGIYLIYFKVYNSGRTKCCFYDFFFFSKLVLGARFSRKWEVGEWDNSEPCTDVPPQLIQSFIKQESLVENLSTFQNPGSYEL